MKRPLQLSLAIALALGATNAFALSLLVKRCCLSLAQSTGPENDTRHQTD